MEPRSSESIESIPPESPVKSRWVTVTFLIILIVVILILIIYKHYQKASPSTEDAFVKANIITISSLVNAPVQTVFVHDHQVVKKGDLLFQLEDRTYLLKLTAAQTQLQIAQQKLAAAVANIAAASAEVAQLNIQRNLTAKNTERVNTLVNRGQAPKTSGEDASAKLQATTQQLLVAQKHAEGLQAETGPLTQDNAALKAARTAVEAAEIELKYTQIKAPTAGVISNIRIVAGDAVAEGSPLCALIDTSHWWITANFPENTLDKIYLHQHAKILLDLYPEHLFSGEVVAIGQSSNNTFSLLPAQNSSGNWIKISQRFPIEIYFNALSNAYPLRVGASATVTLESK